METHACNGGMGVLLCVTSTAVYIASLPPQLSVLQIEEAMPQRPKLSRVELEQYLKVLVDEKVGALSLSPPTPLPSPFLLTILPLLPLHQDTSAAQGWRQWWRELHHKYPQLLCCTKSSKQFGN